MDAKSSQTSGKNFKTPPKHSRESQLGEATTVLLKDSRKIVNDGKKVANELYEEGKNRVYDVQNNIKDYSNKVADRVQERPIISLLVAGGIGFVLSALLRR
ncbi:hypothetical protein [Legionella hackeliae]|uniref:DUF883 domain-containing protein n=1 Tax=Legionella hackeliae TaxID=449 RepID=A0A0A8UPJ6_LEGHA|nr:hypothetical protein [Legionella hackeliae]KTD09869.1 hypothetical protein Lhac_2237 [Legionella hackeliae]CEK10800.1 conserved protein of unknown function [Legionella hackeliae]STX47537.1 Uncharacterised protein [Legionella hackeliae]